MDARGAGGRDAEVGAAERRVAEALRAQASLGGRPGAPTAPPAPPRGGQPTKGPAGKPAHPKPPHAGVPAGAAKAGQGGPARTAQSGPQNQLAARTPHATAAAPRGREQPTQVTVDPALVSAATTQQPSAQGKPARPARPAPARPADAVAARPSGHAALSLQWVLLAAVVAGVLLGCLLAGLSLLDPGLLPALG